MIKGCTFVFQFILDTFQHLAMLSFYADWIRFLYSLGVLFRVFYCRLVRHWAPEGHIGHVPSCEGQIQNLVRI